MTMAEAVLAAKAWKTNQDLEWNRARLIISATRNAGVIARGTKVNSSMLTNPKDIITLPWDRPSEAIEKALSEDSYKKAKLLAQKAKERGLI